jgi:epoxide hydrolase
VSDAPERFEIRVDDALLDDLRARLERTRFADEVEGTGWDAGVPPSYLRDLVTHWLDAYDWRSEEAALNRLDHFRTTIDGQSIHFVHARSPQPDAMPLLLMHGWPGSIVEFLDVIPRLTDSFHVVAPSLPGYAFSEPPRTPGWNIDRIARAFSQLMAQLGHDLYGAQGGDWGAQIGTRLAARDPDHCVGLHLNMPLATRPDEPVVLTDAEQADLVAFATFQREESGYALEQGTKPDTIGAALGDSPAGCLAWIVEKLRAWSDCDGDPERAFTRDRMITNVMLYWVTGTITSSMRLYRERRLAELQGDAHPYVAVPTGVARFPAEPLRFPRAWVARHYHLTHWTDMPRGGHFAAWEQPDLFADDLHAFFGTVR